MRVAHLALIFALFSTLVSCNSPSSDSGSTSNTVNASPTPVGSPSSHEVSISWNASKSKAVNSAGGGYRVYYADSPGVNTSTASYVDVPYVSGATAPTSASIGSQFTGKHYVKVVAYSALNPVGSNSGSTSAASSELAVVVP